MATVVTIRLGRLAEPEEDTLCKRSDTAALRWFGQGARQGLDAHVTEKVQARRPALHQAPSLQKLLLGSLSVQTPANYLVRCQWFLESACAVCACVRTSSLII